MVRRILIFPLVFWGLGVVIIGCQGFDRQASKPTVIISSPPSGSVYAPGDKVLVRVTATDPVGVTNVALSVDGEVVRQDPSPVAQGQAQYSLIQSWIAEGVGQHTLTVQATNSQGVSSESGILVTIEERNGAKATAILTVATAVPIPTGAVNDNPANIASPVAATALPSGCSDNAKFVADLTIPDGTVFTPSAVFTKSWRVLNSGTCPWENYTLVFVNGAQMASDAVYPVPTTLPGQTADLTIPMAAPANYGAYEGTWRLRNAKGQVFGTLLTVVIKVPAPAATSAPTSTVVPTTQPSSCSGQPDDFSFAASAYTIGVGQAVTLSWSAVTNASEVRLDGGEFSSEGVETPGSRTVSPVATTRYSLVAICNNGRKTREKSIVITVSAPTPALANFAGTWNHNFGSMVLAQSGTNVSGSFTDETAQGGTLAGTVAGDTLSGTWEAGGANGTFKIVMANNAKTFSGIFDAKPWCGAQAGESFPNGCAFDGTWESKYGANEIRCALNLNQLGREITGTFCEGTISGSISYANGYQILDGEWRSLPPSSDRGALVFYMPFFTNSQFQGNKDGLAWCGWRANAAPPEPCLR